jgi:hypothetical protein
VIVIFASAEYLELFRALVRIMYVGRPEALRAGKEERTDGVELPH